MSHDNLAERFCESNAYLNNEYNANQVSACQSLDLSQNHIHINRTVISYSRKVPGAFISETNVSGAQCQCSFLAFSIQVVLGLVLVFQNKRDLHCC